MTTTSPPGPGRDVDPRAVTAVDLGFDPADQGFIADPYPVYARLRADHPVSWNPASRQWVVSRFADVSALLRDRRLGRTYLHVATHPEMGHEAPPEWQDPFWRLVQSGMLDREPPDHTRLRRLVSKAFTPVTVESLRPRIEAFVDGILTTALAKGEFDLIADVAEPLPVTVIAELLGVPESDRHLLRPWSSDICLMYELNPSEASQQRSVAASIAFGDYLRGLARRRRKDPGDDLSLRAGPGRRRWRRPDRGRARGHLRPAAQRGPRGIGQRDRQRLVDAVPASRRPGPAPRRPGAGPDGVEELLRFDTPAHVRALGPGGHRAARGPHPARPGARPPVRVGEPRPGRLRPRRRARPGPQAEPAPLLRGGNPLLPGGAAGEAGDGRSCSGELLVRMPALELVEAPAWKPTFVLRGLQELRVRVP